jgi:hypothetical protein
MDKLKINLKVTQKSYIINPVEEKDIRISINKNREWAIFIEIINIIGEIIKSFFINKGMYVLLDFIKIIIKLEAILAYSYNR